MIAALFDKKTGEIKQTIEATEEIAQAGANALGLGYVEYTYEGDDRLLRAAVLDSTSKVVNGEIVEK